MAGISLWREQRQEHSWGKPVHKEACTLVSLSTQLNNPVEIWYCRHPEDPGWPHLSLLNTTEATGHLASHLHPLPDKRKRFREPGSASFRSTKSGFWLQGCHRTFILLKTLLLVECIGYRSSFFCSFPFSSFLAVVGIEPRTLCMLGKNLPLSNPLSKDSTISSLDSNLTQSTGRASPFLSHLILHKAVYWKVLKLTIFPYNSFFSHSPFQVGAQRRKEIGLPLTPPEGSWLLTAQMASGVPADSFLLGL